MLPHLPPYYTQIDYISAKGEAHTTYLFGSDRVGSREEFEERMTTFVKAFESLGREVVHVQRIETSAVTVHLERPLVTVGKPTLRLVAN